MILIEPAGPLNPIPDSDLPILARIPTLILYGDFISTSEFWISHRSATAKLASRIIAAGGDVTLIDLPKIGIPGNSHFIMFDRNSSQIANLIECWMKSRRLIGEDDNGNSDHECRDIDSNKHGAEMDQANAIDDGNAKRTILGQDTDD